MSEELVKQGPQALEVTEQRPSWIPEGDATGTAMSRDDIRLPRLAIAQGPSPQLTPGDSAFIEDLKMFDLFNNLTGQVYGKGPLTFVPVRHDVRRIEFTPRSEGGGVVDINVPANDPRMQWGEAEDGSKIPPVATKFEEFIVFLLHPDGSREPIVLSIKMTNKFNRNAARNLCTFIALPHPRFGMLPIYGKKYTISTTSEKNDSGTFGVPVIKQAGVLTDADAGLTAMAFAESLEDKNIIVDRDASDDASSADVPF